MPRIPSIPRLSIIVPVGNDVVAFEDTLVSVLENQPAGSEILVVHDGSYADPFDLVDEVRFITTDFSGEVALLTAATAKARGRFIHVLSPGLHATGDWADAALEQFEHPNTAAVAPLIRNAKGRIVAAGWRDRAGHLCQPVAASAAKVDVRDARQILGPYLQASFWRRDVLCGLASAFQSGSMLEATYAYGRMLITGDWRCSFAAGSGVSMNKYVDLSGPSTFSRGQRLWAIKKAIDPATQQVPWTQMLGALLRPKRLAETWGQVRGSKALSDVQSRVDMQAVPCHSDHGVIQLPSHCQPAKRHAA